MSNNNSINRFIQLSKAQIKLKKKYDKTNKKEFLDLFNKIDEKLKKINIELITELNCYRHVSKKEYDFLNEINKKLCSYKTKEIYLNLRGDSFFISKTFHTNYKISRHDLIKLEKIFQSTCMIFYPVKTNEFLNIGYELYDYKNKKVVLNFTEKQLPEKVDFKVLSRFFNSKTNLKKAKKVGVDISEEKVGYLI
jgi:hypothetical protein